MSPARITSVPVRLFHYTGSNRTEPDIRQLVEDASSIWAQADIRFSAGGLVWLDHDQAVDNALDVLRTFPAPTTQNAVVEALNTLLARHDDGSGSLMLCAFPYLAANGLTRRDLLKIWIGDETSVKDGRVLAHEIGHILLDVDSSYHKLCESAQLMADAGEGTRLTDREIRKARSRVRELGF